MIDYDLENRLHHQTQPMDSHKTCVNENIHINKNMVVVDYCDLDYDHLWLTFAPIFQNHHHKA